MAFKCHSPRPEEQLSRTLHNIPSHHYLVVNYNKDVPQWQASSQENTRERLHKTGGLHGLHTQLNTETKFSPTICKVDDTGQVAIKQTAQQATQVGTYSAHQNGDPSRSWLISKFNTSVRDPLVCR